MRRISSQPNLVMLKKLMREVVSEMEKYSYPSLIDKKMKELLKKFEENEAILSDIEIFNRDGKWYGWG